MDRDRLLLARLRPPPVALPAQPRVLDPGRLRGAAHPAGAEPPGRARPAARRGGPARQPAHAGRGRVPGPRAGRLAPLAGQDRGHAGARSRSGSSATRSAGDDDGPEPHGTLSGWSVSDGERGVRLLPRRFLGREVRDARLLVLLGGVQHGVVVRPVSSAIAASTASHSALRAAVRHREEVVGPVRIGRALVAVRDAAERGHRLRRTRRAAPRARARRPCRSARSRRCGGRARRRSGASGRSRGTRGRARAAPARSKPAPAAASSPNGSALGRQVELQRADRVDLAVGQRLGRRRLARGPRLDELGGGIAVALDVEVDADLEEAQRGHRADRRRPRRARRAARRCARGRAASAATR